MPETVTKKIVSAPAGTIFVYPPVYIRGKIVYNKENVRLSGKGAGSTEKIKRTIGKRSFA